MSAPVDDGRPGVKVPLDVRPSTSFIAASPVVKTVGIATNTLLSRMMEPEFDVAAAIVTRRCTTRRGGVRVVLYNPRDGAAQPLVRLRHLRYYKEHAYITNRRCNGSRDSAFYGGGGDLVSQIGASKREDKPSAFEYVIANFALAQTIPGSAKQLKNPIETTPENLRKGKDDFHDHCAICHGDDGQGKTPMAAGMSPEVPDLHAAHVQKWTDGELFYIVENGVRFTGMPGWNFDEDRIWQLVLVVRGFRP